MNSIVTNKEINDVIERLKEAKAREKEVEKEIDKLKQELYNYVNEHEVLIDYETGEEVVTWKYGDAPERFDVKKLKEKHYEIFKQFTYLGDPIRTLRIK